MKRYTQEQIMSRDAALEKLGLYVDGNKGYLSVEGHEIEIDFTYVDEINFLPIIMKRVFSTGERFGTEQVRAKLRDVLGLGE